MRALWTGLLLCGLAPLAAQAEAGLTPIQVMRLRQVTQVVALRDGDAAFLRTAPRLAGDAPGPAYVEAWLLRGGVEQPLLTGKVRVSALAIDPQSGAPTVLHRGPEDEHPEVWSLRPAEPPQRLTRTPHGIASYAWRPDGGAIAFTVTEQPTAEQTRAAAAGFKQRIVDEDYRQLQLQVWDRETGGIRPLTKAGCVHGFVWAPDGTRLVAGIAPRNLVDDSYMATKLHVVDAATGDVKLLVDNPGKLGHAAWSPDSQRIAYVSAADRRDPHAGMLYVVGLDGAEPRALTEGLRGMVHHIEFAPDGAGILAAVSFGVRSRLARFDTQSGEQELLLPEHPPAFREFSVSPDGKSICIVGSTAHHPAEVYRLFPAAAFGRLSDSNPWLNGIPLGVQQVRTITARDGIPIEGLLIHPLQRADGERRPLVIVVHGGPEAHFDDGWLTSYSQWGQLLAARGWFGWFPNYRASTGYGVAFAKLDHGDVMGGEFEDHLDAIAQFAEEGLIDARRVGIGGGSYGGYTAAWAATAGTEHFAAAVSFVPFTDIRTKWLTSDIPSEFFHVHYEQKNPLAQAGYLADRSPLTWAAQCRTPLLLLGGTSDPRVHPSQPHMLWRAVEMHTDTPVRYVQYPGEGHGNRTNVYQYDYCVRTLRWFEHYLAPGDRRTAAPPPSELDYSAWYETAEKR